MTDLDTLRKEIEETDLELMKLLRKRLDLALSVGKYKAENGIPIRNISVEEDVVKRYRDFACKHEMDQEYAELICRTIMKESVERQTDLIRKTESPKHIAIVGGNGQMGRWFEKFFKICGHTVDIIDPSLDNGLAPEDMGCADIILVSVPISKVKEVLKTADRFAKENALIFDITSLKTPFIDTIRELAVKRKVCSIHPMFGPSAKSFFDQNMLICNCGSESAIDEVLNLFGKECGNLKVIDISKHDTLMSYVLGLSHAVNIAFFTVLERSGIPHAEMESAGSTTYRKMMDTNRSVAMEDPYLYYEIQHLNADRDRILEEFDRSVKDVVAAALSDDPSAFKDLMDQGHRYFL